MNLHLVSVIVPVYNQEKTILRCIDSIRHQTYQDIEIIIIDDGSTDRSGDICDDLAKCDRRIRVYHKKNGGVSSARNFALGCCKGDYITFVDSDDYVVEEYVEYLYRTVINLGVRAAWCGYKTVNSVAEDDIKNATHSFNRMQARCIDVYVEYDYGRQFYLRHNCTAIFERNLLSNKSFSTQIFVGEDALFNAQIIKEIRYIGYLDQELYYYVQYSKSASHRRYDEKRATAVTAWKEIVSTYSECNERFLLGCYVSLAYECKAGLEELAFQIPYKENIYKMLLRELRGILHVLMRANLSIRQKAGLVICAINPRLLAMIRRIINRK